MRHLRSKRQQNSPHLFTARLNIDDNLSGSVQFSFDWKSILLASFANNGKEGDSLILWTGDNYCLLKC